MEHEYRLLWGRLGAAPIPGPAPGGVRTEFKKAWQARQRPRIEDYLPQRDEDGHPVLLRELILLDAEYRRQNGERPAAAEYRRRFPQDAALIDAVFSDANSAGPTKSRGHTGPYLPNGKPTC